MLHCLRPPNRRIGATSTGVCGGGACWYSGYCHWAPGITCYAPYAIDPAAFGFYPLKGYESDLGLTRLIWTARREDRVGVSSDSMLLIVYPQILDLEMTIGDV